MMNVSNPWHFEPVLIGAAVRSVILCFVAFGVDMTDNQIAAIMLALEAILAIFTRGSVMTPATIHQAGMTMGAIESKAAKNNAEEPKR